MTDKGKIVNWAKRRWLFSLSVLGLFLMLSHQNCAPSGAIKGSSADTSAGTSVSTQVEDGAQPVSIIDDSKTSAALSFSMKSVQLDPAASSAVVQGNCSSQQDDALLGWKIEKLDVNGQAIEKVVEGFATCKSSVFNVNVAVAQLSCGQPYQVTARLGFGVPGVVGITKPCAN